MEFKVGDKVKILDRVGDERSYYPSYTNNMLKYAGNITSIKEITNRGALVLDNNDYFWDKKAVKLVNEDKYLYPSQLKDGDFIKIGNSFVTYIYIFKEYKNNIIYRHASFNLNNSRINIDPFINWSCIDKTIKITYATEEEKILLNTALLKEGYIWNDLTKKLQNIQTVALSNNSVVTINGLPMVNDLVDIYNFYPAISHIKYRVFTDSIKEKTNKEELNLFPTKEHYRLNFNINN